MFTTNLNPRCNWTLVFPLGEQHSGLKQAICTKLWAKTDYKLLLLKSNRASPSTGALLLCGPWKSIEYHFTLTNVGHISWWFKGARNSCSSIGWVFSNLNFTLRTCLDFHHTTPPFQPIIKLYVFVGSQATAVIIATVTQRTAFKEHRLARNPIWKIITKLFNPS